LCILSGNIQEIEADRSHVLDFHGEESGQWKEEGSMRRRWKVLQKQKKNGLVLRVQLYAAV
jgi:hypothetical protein